MVNENFRDRNENKGITADVFKDAAADVEIEFCLANVDPNGYKTSGITRTRTYHENFYIFFNGFNFVKFDLTGGKDAWPTDQYLNVWVCTLAGVQPGGVIGYAQFPGGPAETDGVVMDYRFTGSVGEVPFYPAHDGKVLTHEIGHWLNLSHIWGDLFGAGDCTSDDAVDDTPLQAGPNGGYAYPCTFPGRNSCDEGEGDLPDMFYNYMDYTNPECMTMFTKGQKARMRALFEPGGPRESLLYSKGCSKGLDLALALRPRCNDGIRNGNEEGVDCGGDCPPCPVDPFCISGGDIPFEEWIETVQISGDGFVTYTNNSGFDFGYGNYTDEKIVLTPGNTYKLDLTPGYGSLPFDEWWKVFVDWNGDLDFEDEGEVIFNSNGARPGPVTGLFTVPSTASSTVRMRVVMKFFEFGFDETEPEPCGIYFFGETEDYLISFFNCNAPQNISARIYGDDIIVKWDPVLSADEYKIRYSQGGRWHSAICPGTQFRLENAPMGSYIFQVYAICGGGSSEGSKQVNISIGGGGSSGHRISEVDINSSINNSLGILQLFPNPTSTNINISYTAINEQVTIQVRDILGRSVMTQQIQNAANQITSMEVGHLPNGIYYLNLYDGKKLVTEKFVKE